MGAVPTRTYKMSATAERFHNSTAKNKGVMGCLPCWTEVMTPGGWVRIDEWDGEEIMVWSPKDDVTRFEKPTGGIVQKSDGFLSFPVYRLGGMNLDFEIEAQDAGWEMVVSRMHRVAVIIHGKHEVRTAVQLAAMQGDDVFVELQLNHEDSVSGKYAIRCDGRRLVHCSDGFEYCFETSTGFFVVRQNGHVFVTGNCVGNGKTVIVMHDLLFRSEGQVPDPRDNVRRSRWFVIRNTYQQLMNSTVKSWLEWFPDTVMKYSPHPVGLLRRPSMRNDGTTVEIELMFFALDKAEQERDLLGVEATGAWINEAREISEDHMAAVQSRIGRYPATRDDYKPLSLGMLMDTNPPDDQSWWYRLAEVEKPVGWEFFKCPPALLRIEDKKTGKVRYEPNRGQDPAIPAAENIEHLSEGFNYYLKQVAVWPDAKVRVMVCGEYGTILTGVPVYPQWNDEANLMERELEPMWGLPIFVGTDGGFTPSAVAGQVLPNGQIAVYDELVAENISCGEFAERFLRPWLINSFRLAEGQRLMCFHDPSGLGAGKTSDGVTEIVAMQQKGIPVMPCPVQENAVGLRLECVREAMRRRVDGGKGGLVVSRKCKTLLAGLRGRYQYRRLNTSSSEKRYADSPDKGPLSHVQDALQYMVYGALHPDGSPQGRDPFSTKPPDARLWLPQSARGETGTQQALATGLDLAGYF